MRNLKIVAVVMGAVGLMSALADAAPIANQPASAIQPVERSQLQIKLTVEAEALSEGAICDENQHQRIKVTNHTNKPWAGTAYLSVSGGGKNMPVAVPAEGSTVVDVVTMAKLDCKKALTGRLVKVWNSAAPNAVIFEKTLLPHSVSGELNFNAPPPQSDKRVWLRGVRFSTDCSGPSTATAFLMKWPGGPSGPPDPATIKMQVGSQPSQDVVVQVSQGMTQQANYNYSGAGMCSNAAGPPDLQYNLLTGKQQSGALAVSSVTYQ